MTAEGEVIGINKAITGLGEAREDWRIIQDLARVIGREHGFNVRGPRGLFEELWVGSKGGVADYSGITWGEIERQQGVFWPCPSEDHAGTPRIFEPASWNVVAQGKGPFYFLDGKARLQRRDLFALDGRYR